MKFSPKEKAVIHAIKEVTKDKKQFSLTELHNLMFADLKERPVSSRGNLATTVNMVTYKIRGTPYKITKLTGIGRGAQAQYAVSDNFANLTLAELQYA